MAHVNITPKTYNARSKEIPFSKLPKDLADTHGEMSMYLEFYGQDTEITEVVDLYLSKVNQFMANPPKPKPVVKPTPKPAPKPPVKQTAAPVKKEVEQPKEDCGCNGKSFADYIKNPKFIAGSVAGAVLGMLLKK